MIMENIDVITIEITATVIHDDKDNQENFIAVVIIVMITTILTNNS